MYPHIPNKPNNDRLMSVHLDMMEWEKRSIWVIIQRQSIGNVPSCIGQIQIDERLKKMEQATERDPVLTRIS